jgi:hypothetical protein
MRLLNELGRALLDARSAAILGVLTQPRGRAGRHLGALPMPRSASWS